MGARFESSTAAMAVVLVLAGGGAVGAQSAAAATVPAACHPESGAGPGSSPPAELPGSLEGPVLSSYAVFARPQSASDQLPPVNSVGLSLEFRIAGYYPSEIRQLLALPNGRRYMVVPGFMRAFEVPPAICLPKKVRKERPKLVEEEMRRRTKPAFCIVELGAPRSFGGNGECALFSEVAASEAVFSVFPESASMVELVPNGVSKVRVVYPRGLVVSASVTENAYLLNVPAPILRKERQAERRLRRVHFRDHPTKAQIRAISRFAAKVYRRLDAEAQATRVEWLAADGTVLHTATRPHPDARILFI